MSLSCRSCLTQSQNDYFSLLTVFPEFGKHSILDLLNYVTSSEITYSEDLPCELCITCFKSLKSAYNFIVLFKNSQEFLQKLSEEESKLNKPKRQNTVVVKKEGRFDQILNPEDPERIVIVNDDGSTYTDMVQEIFGDGTTEDKKSDIQKMVKGVKDIKSSNIMKSSKIILVAVDDVLKQKAPLNHTTINDAINTLYQEREREVPFSMKGKVLFNEEDYIKEEEDYFIEEANSNDIGRNDNEEPNSPYEGEEVEIHSDENIEEEQDLKLDILEMEKNRDRNIDNIQIVTIDDVLNTEKKSRGEKKTLLSVEDVLNIKPRTKKLKVIETEILSCDFCKRIFDSRRKLMLHKMRIHNPDWREKFKCHICGLQCKTMSAHKHHLAKHENKRYPCDQCEKTYLTKSKLREHILRVHEKKLDNKYLCNECGKGFKFSNALDYHMNKHTNSRNFVCRYCGFACIALSALKRHERTHTGERPYKCKHCKKTFAGAAEKQKHEFGHEGVFRYHCKYCEKPFIQTYNMKVHWMQHKGPYVCEICKRNFADAEILKFHYAHSHKIRDVIIEDADSVDVKSEAEVLEDEDGDDIAE